MAKFDLFIRGAESVQVDAEEFQTDPHWIIFYDSTFANRNAVAAFPREEVITVVKATE